MKQRSFAEMFKNNLRFFLFLILLLSKNAFAEWYIGGVYSFAMIDAPGAAFAAPAPPPPDPLPPVDKFLLDLDSEEFIPSVLIVKAGYDLHRFLAAELRVGVGLFSGKRSSFDIKREVDVATLYGAYLKLQTGNKVFNPYFMLGYANIDVDVKGPVVSGGDDDSDVSYGVGIEAAMSDNLFFNLEFMHYLDEDDITARAISVGVVARY